MRVVVINRDANGGWRDPVTGETYDLMEVEEGVRLATRKPVVNAESAAAAAGTFGWERVAGDEGSVL